MRIKIETVSLNRTSSRAGTMRITIYTICVTPFIVGSKLRFCEQGIDVERAVLALPSRLGLSMTRSNVAEWIAWAVTSAIKKRPQSQQRKVSRLTAGGYHCYRSMIGSGKPSHPTRLCRSRSGHEGTYAGHPRLTRNHAHTLSTV